MLLASVSDILSDLGFDAMTDITASATLALDAAEAQLASVLNSEFEQGTFTDTFFVSAPPYRDGPVCETEFRLRRGLVQSLTSMVYAGTVAGLADSPALSEAQIKLDKTVLGIRYSSLINRKLRYAPLSILPL